MWRDASLNWMLNADLLILARLTTAKGSRRGRDQMVLIAATGKTFFEERLSCIFYVTNMIVTKASLYLLARIP